jgi:peroxiredoxin
MIGPRISAQEAASQRHNPNEAIETRTDQASAYRMKWKAMLKRPDFEKEIPAIRAEIEAILKSDIEREEALLAASFGYDAIADDEGRERIESLVLSELPESDWARQILWSRALNEKEKLKQEAMIERFIARYPNDNSLSQMYATLFRLKAVRQSVAGGGLAKIGDEWIRSLEGKTYETVRATETVGAVLAERQIELERAQVLADEAVRLVDELSKGPAAPVNNLSNQGPAALSLLKESAHTARGLVLLKRGRIDEAARELTEAFQQVIKQVESNGFILWKDMQLREVGVRPRVLWLAELYQLQGDFERAARYLIAGYSDNEQANSFIRERLPVIYQKLGRSGEEASAAIRAAEARYISLTARTPAAKEEEKKWLIAARVNMPAPDFRITTMNRKEVRLSDLKGRIVVLNFWATWCGPCVAEMPFFQQSFDRYKSNADVRFFAVSIDHVLPAVRPFIQKNGYFVPMAYESGAAELFGVRSIPMTVIIDRDGLIQYQERGYGGEGKDYVERMSWRIDELLKAARPAGASETVKER